jgi:hypothetical protein
MRGLGMKKRNGTNDRSGEHKPDEGQEKNIPDFFKSYDCICRGLEKENNLIHNRIQWATALSASIFTIQGSLVSGIVAFHSSSPCFIPVGFLVGFLLFMSGLSAIATYYCRQSEMAVCAAFRQIDYFRNRYLSLENLFEETLMLPRPFRPAAEHTKASKAAYVFPKAMVAIWMFITVLESAGALGSFFLGTGIQSALASAPKSTQQQQSAPAEHPLMLPLVIKLAEWG